MARDNVDLLALGAFIREQRTHLGLTQEQLATRCAWAQERVSVLENGKYGTPSLPALVRLAAALEVSVVMLVEAMGLPAFGGGVDSAFPGDAESHILLQYTLQRLLAIDAMTLKSALAQASDQMAMAMGADKIDAFIYDAPTNSLVALGSSNTPMGRLQHESGLSRVPLANHERTAQIYESGDMFYTGDAQHDPHISIGVKETLGVHSFLGVPLRVNGTIKGVLAAESGEPNRFSQEDQRFFIAASQWVGMVAHRAELVEATRQTVAEEARREAADEVIEALAHDLGNRLTPLKGRLDVLRRRLEQGGQTREWEQAEEASHAVAGIQELVSRLLDVSRLDHGLFALALQPVDVSHLVAEVAEELCPIWSNLTIRTAEVPEIEGDPVRLQEVLTNLVTNAMQHSPAGSPITLGVGTEVREDGRWVLVTVTDEGPGIAPDLLPRIFERFAGGHERHGMGLGLYLARRLVEAHGGSLTVQTAVNAGTTFCLELPARSGCAHP
jgi:two-component system, OmpR family, sensor kinase